MEPTVQPTDAAEVCEIVRRARESSSPICPIGGGTSLDFGLPLRRGGRVADEDVIGVQLTNLNRVIDYPAADMTITVEAGVTMQQLAETLAQNGQQLPLDVPDPQQATLGGVLATDFSGPRRFGCGTARDYVIGIRAVDGQGQTFAGGGRVVKNVAGYDFCKMLVGSLGTLAIITEVTLKVTPIRPARAAMIVQADDLQQVDEILQQLVHTQTSPVLIEWLTGPGWNQWAQQTGWPHGDVGCLVIGLEGTAAEVEWMIEQLSDELSPHGRQQVDDDAYGSLLSTMKQFPADSDYPIVLRCGARPSRLALLVETVRKHLPEADIQAHAGNGIARIGVAQPPVQGIAATLIGSLHPLVRNHQGHVIMLRNRDGEMTHQAVWGPLSSPLSLMQRIKQQFDPHDILNPGRFVY